MFYFETEFNAVSYLVKDFQGNEKHYTSPECSEVDVRGDYIGKFFTALGWDVRKIPPLYLSKTESDKNYLQRICATLDKQIDQLVYQLYGLTEEEIKLVEESVK